MKNRLKRHPFLALALSGIVMIAAGIAAYRTNTRLQTSDAEPVFIFDLGGVLIETSGIGIAREVGLRHFFFYGVREGFRGIRERLQGRMFELLETLGKQTAINGTLAQYNGLPLPDIMCRWQRGEMTSQELIAQATRKMKELKKQNWFNSNREYKLIKKLIKASLSPVHAEHTKIIPQGLALLEQCKRAGYRVYVLSNYDYESFAVLQEKFPEIFSRIDGYVVSGQVGCMKPDPLIYAHLLDKFRLCPHQCYFIDNQSENIQAAEALGITGLLCEDKQFGSINACLNEQVFAETITA